MNILENIIDSENIKQIENKLVYNCLSSESASSKFYSSAYSNTNKTSSNTSSHTPVAVEHKEKGGAYKVMEGIVTHLKDLLPPNASVIEIGGGVYQHRSGNINQHFSNYFPLDISDNSIRRYASEFKKIGFIADATKLPFKNDSVDAILTHTFLEHPIHPEKVLKEIVRVLKPGGIVVHNDAWFCRWWQRYGVVGLKKFNKMTPKEKVISMGAYITEIPLLRIPPIIVKRFTREVFGNKDNNLRYKKLKPNYNLFLGCDEDAASNIDPIDVVPVAQLSVDKDS